MALPSRDEPDWARPVGGHVSIRSRTERRGRVWNNGRTPTWHQVTGHGRLGKFFPRGCRGFIDDIEIYCRDAAAAGGTITVYITPYIGAGYTYTANVVVPVGGAPAWRVASFNVMWEYDSLFIYVVMSVATVEAGYDTETPHDYFYSADAGVTWDGFSRRYWFRVLLKAQTAGDVPISGTINTVEIPSVSGVRQFIQLPVPADTELLDTIQLGVGELLYCLFYAGTEADASYLFPRIYCDGNTQMPIDTGMTAWTSYLGTVSHSPGICKGGWADIYYVLIVTIPYPFRRSLQIGFYNSDAANPHTGRVAYNYKRIA